MLLSHSVYNYTWWHCEFTVLLSHSVYKCTWRHCKFTVLLSHSMYIMTMCVSSVAVSLYLHHGHATCVSRVAVSLCLSASWPCVFPVVLPHSVYIRPYYTCVFPVLLSDSVYIMSTWVSNVAILHQFWQRSRPLSLTRTVELKGCIHVWYSENWLLKMQVKPQSKQLFAVHGLAANLWHL